MPAWRLPVPAAALLAAVHVVGCAAQLSASSEVLDNTSVLAAVDLESATLGLNDTAPLPTPAPVIEKVVRILHISDTHNLHRAVEAAYPFPPADIVLHTGDMTNFGTDAELADVNAWFGSLKSRYPHVIAIAGNHDWVDGLKQVQANQLDPSVLLDPTFLQAKLPNVQLLSDETAEVMGIRIHGAGHLPWYSIQHPGDAPLGSEGWWDGARATVFKTWVSRTSTQGVATQLLQSPQASLPTGIDVLMTHDPARSVFDMSLHGWWGSSQDLHGAIVRAGPRAHLFGHVHEQRGLWVREGSDYEGGVEYRSAAGTPFRPMSPPPTAYPVELISNNAVVSNAFIDKAESGQWLPMHVVAPPRLITATLSGGRWSFSAAPAAN